MNDGREAVAKRSTISSRRAFLRQSVMDFMLERCESAEEALELTNQVLQMVWSVTPKFDTPVRIIEHMPTGRWCVDVAVKVRKTDGEGR